MSANSAVTVLRSPSRFSERQFRLHESANHSISLLVQPPRELRAPCRTLHRSVCHLDYPLRISDKDSRVPLRNHRRTSCQPDFRFCNSGSASIPATSPNNPILYHQAPLPDIADSGTLELAGPGF